MICVDDVEAFVSVLEPTPARSPGVFDPQRPSVFNPTPSPGDDFDADNRIEALLVADGHTPVGTTASGDGITYTRAGKDPREGPSMTAFPARNVVTIHTTSIPGIRPGTYGPFNYLTATRHNGDHSAAARNLKTATPNTTANSDGTSNTEPPGLDLINFNTLDEREEAISEGIAHPGRWTSFAGPAKSGKSTFLVYVVVHIARGYDPFDLTPLPGPAKVLMVSAEMGRLDLAELIDSVGINPADVDHFHATDLVPLLDTPSGAAQLLATVDDLDIDIVLIDGINGTISGAEKDDEPWRRLFHHTIAPLKRRGVAVISADNLGKDATLGPRGSSVKLDKPDAVIQLSRTDNGTRLKATHRRSAAYPADRTYNVTGLDGTDPIRYRRTDEASPAGTRTTIDALNRLNAPLDISRRAARALLNEHDHKVSNDALGAALKLRRNMAAKWSATQRTTPSDDLTDHAPGPNTEKPSDQAGPTPGPRRTTPQTPVRKLGVWNEVHPQTDGAPDAIPPSRPNPFFDPETTPEGAHQ